MAQSTNTRSKRGISTISMYIKSLNNDELSQYTFSTIYGSVAQREIARRKKRQEKTK